MGPSPQLPISCIPIRREVSPVLDVTVEPPRLCLGSIPGEVIVQVLAWLPIPNIVAVSSSCQLLFEAIPESTRRVGWPGRRGDNWPGVGAGRGMGEKIQVDAPFLDLAEAGNGATDEALHRLLGLLSVPLGLVDKCENEARRGQWGDEVQELPGTTKESPLIRGLVLSSENISDKGLHRALASYGTGLKVLGLSGCLGLWDPATPAVIGRHCSNLMDLDLSNTLRRPVPQLLINPLGTPLLSKQVNPERKYVLDNVGLDAMLEGIGEGLEFLRLYNCLGLTLCGAPIIARKCPRLKELDVGFDAQTLRWALWQHKTDETLATLAAAPCANTLVYLGLRGCADLTVAGLRLLCTSFPGLQRLDLACVSRANDVLLTGIAQAVSLREINLSWCVNITGAGIVPLAQGSPDLRGVSLHATSMTDEGVRALCRDCHRLRWINLSLTPVTGRVLRSLALRESLRWVNLRCCMSLTGQGVRERASELRRGLASFRAEGGCALALERPSVALEQPLVSTDCIASPSPVSAPLPATRDIGATPTISSLTRTVSSVAVQNGSVISSALPHLSQSNTTATSTATTITTSVLLAPATGTVPEPVSNLDSTSNSIPSSAGSDTKLPLKAYCIEQEHVRGGLQRWMGRQDTVLQHNGNVGLEVSRGRKGSHQGPGTRLLPGMELGLEHGHRQRRGWGWGPELGEGYRCSGEDFYRRGWGRANEGNTVDFDWNKVPRGCGAGELAKWKGFHGLPGDVARAIILELHPYTEVAFAAKWRDDRSGVGSAGRSHHGYQVHTNPFGIAWAELVVDEQGCVV